MDLPIRFPEFLLPRDLGLTARGTVADATRIPWNTFRDLRCGCYLVTWTEPGGLPPLDGTLRVECVGAARRLSGDVYRRPFKVESRPGRPSSLRWGPDPSGASRVPVFSRDSYEGYLRVTAITPENPRVKRALTIGFERWRYRGDAPAPGEAARWSLDGRFVAVLHSKPAPSGYPQGADYYQGTVLDDAGEEAGTLTMGWVSRFLRRATIEMDSVGGADLPLDNGLGVGWSDLAEQIDWDLDVATSDQLSTFADTVWTPSACHSAMQFLRDSDDLDTEWRYHLLCVRRLDEYDSIAFDRGSSDLNGVPREGAAVASDARLPLDPSLTADGVPRFADTPFYFRSAVRVISGCMGLSGAALDGSYVVTTEYLSELAAYRGDTILATVEWTHNAGDRGRLKHWPDIYVRPGGASASVGYYGPASITSPPRSTPTFLASPLTQVLPLGAPLRLALRLSNDTREDVLVPARLGLGPGTVRGRVIDPSGRERTFRPLWWPSGVGGELLAPRESKSGALTLLRGEEGPLFAGPGLHRVLVEAVLPSAGGRVAYAAETSVMVTGAENPSHARAALAVLSAPETLLAWALGGDRYPAGCEAIQRALQDPVLRPHYAFCEVKRLLQADGDRPADVPQAASLIDDDVIMSRSELATLEALSAALHVAESAIATLLGKLERWKVTSPFAAPP